MNNILPVPAVSFIKACKLIYRVIGENNNARLGADETLDKIADWAAGRKDKPDIGEGRAVTKIVITMSSSRPVKSG